MTKPEHLHIVPSPQNETHSARVKRLEAEASNAALALAEEWFEALARASELSIAVAASTAMKPGLRAVAAQISRELGRASLTGASLFERTR